MLRAVILFKLMKVTGINAVYELLESGKTIEKVLVKQNPQSEGLKRLIGLCRDKGIPVKFVPVQKLDKLFKGVHQGVVAFVSPVEYVALETLVEQAFAQTGHPVFLLLDGITDTRNFGAILRSAAAFEVNGVIVPANNSAPLNDEVAKTSAGGIFKTAICRVKHLADAVYYLKSYGTEIIAATEKAGHMLETYRFEKPVALIMGNEHKGISGQLLKQADVKLKINISPGVDSLNVSVAAAVFLYEIHRQFFSSK
jgi:23S rRNA (guanosine2251-2'-O)-methyltransferase